MTDNFREFTTRRSIVVEAGQAEALRETLARLREEVGELRASRERLALAGDADRRAIERELHDGVQQHLVALAVNLQLATPLVEAEPAAARKLLEEMGHDVQQALDETAHLAQRIYAPLLTARDLAPALRAAAVSAGIPASVEVEAGSRYAPEVAWTVYLCWLEVLRHAGHQSRPMVIVREGERALAFEVVADCADSDAELLRLRDRVEALGGRLTIRSEPRRGTRVAGSLPLSR
jgi:signal transduction histidine kinase